MCRNYASELVRIVECLLEFLFHEVIFLALVLHFCDVHELATLFQEIFCVIVSVQCEV